MKVRLTGVSGIPFNLPQTFDKYDAERTARFYRTLGLTAEVVDA